MGKIAHQQSLVFNERGQLSQAIPQSHMETNVSRMNANRAIRIAAQRTQGLRGVVSVSLREIWLQTNASDSNCSNNSR